MKLKDGLEGLACGGSLDWESPENTYFLNPRMPAEQIRAQTELLEKVAGSFSSTLFLLTSGTTGGSVGSFKWVALPKQAFLKSAEEVNRALDSSPQSKDRWLHLLPDFHVGGLAVRARSFLSGASALRLARWGVKEVIDSISQNRGTLLTLVPAQIFDLCQANQVCPPTVRTALVGGGALSPALYQRAVELGWPVRLTYAMTEACSTIALTPLPSVPFDGAVPAFELLPHFEVRTEERLWLKGESLLAASIESSSGAGVRMVDPKIEGWFETSDRGRVVGRRLELLGRAHDLIKIGGEKVEMSRLQQILEGVRAQCLIPADCALVPMADERLENVIHLVTDLTLSLEQFERLRTTFDAQVLPFEKIRQWHRVDQIPRTDLGKLKVQSCIELLNSVARAL